MTDIGSDRVERRRRATSVEVARLAGVSQSAVSRCFTAGASIAPDTREKVMTAARALGYRPNVLARGLVGSRTDLVGVVVGNLDTPFEAFLFDRLTDALAAIGKKPLVVRSDPAGDVARPLLAALDYQVDGVVVLAGGVTRATVDSAKLLGVPLILYGFVTTADLVDCVCCDNAAGARLAADALLASRYRRAAYVTGRSSAFSEGERRAAFLDRMARGGRPVVRVVEGDYSHSGGMRAGLTLLSAADRPDAVFCGNDATAFGVIDAARRRLGLRVPEDVAVIGFDDVPMAAWPGYDLTTVRNPVDAIVAAVRDILARRLADAGEPYVVHRTTPTLIRRGSAVV